MRSDEMTFQHVVNGRPVTVWVTFVSSRPGDFCLTATDDEDDREIQLPQADYDMFYDKVYDMGCGE